MTTAPDYGDSTPVAATPEGVFPALNKLVAEAMKRGREIVDLEAKLSQAKTGYANIVERQLPDLMETSGVEKFETTDLVIAVKEKVQNSVPKDRKEEACKWLEDHGHGDVVKREVAVAFGVGEQAESVALAKRLAFELGRSVNVENKVEASTLKAIIVKRLDAGEEVPMDLFGVRKFKVAEFKVK